MLPNPSQHMATLQYGMEIAGRFKEVILYKYLAVEQLCIHNKAPGQIFVQYLGITYRDFINFLSEATFPKQLIDHVNSSDYRIINEITVVYDTATVSFVRGSFYGML